MSAIYLILLYTANIGASYMVAKDTKNKEQTVKVCPLYV